MNVLSLFDGMSCGQIALERAGIKVDNYYASEIKPHAIKVTQHNYPKTIQLGDVTKITKEMLPKIDMVIGGSPCQDFSRGNKERLGLDGEKSGLFMQYLRIVEEVKPKFFLLENVVMDFLDRKFIDDSLNCLPVRINSNLVSAQLRDRFYWTNIGPSDTTLFRQHECLIPPPNDRGIKLKDILTSGFVESDKSYCLNTKYNQGRSQEGIRRRRSVAMDSYVFLSPDLNDEKGLRFFNVTELERLQTLPENYTEILTPTQACNCIGDGWTVDVIAHIFSFLPEEYKNAL